MLPLHPPIESWPLVVVGAGAAGLLAAIAAAQAGARVLLLETRRRPGAKIRASGGGRCNVLPSHVLLDDFATSGSTKALRNVLFSWPLAAVRQFFETELGVALKCEASGKLFPVSDSAKEVVDALLACVQRLGIELRGDAQLVDLQPDPAGLRLQLLDGRVLLAQRVVLATGGLSLPKTGSDGGGWRLTGALGHKLVAPSPALVPLHLDAPALHDLAGLSLPVVLRAWAGAQLLQAVAGDILLTHRGLSGPATLDISAQLTDPASRLPAAPRRRLTLQWGAQPWAPLLAAPGALRLGAALRSRLPRRLADLLLAQSGLPAEQTLCTLARAPRADLAGLLDASAPPLVGDGGYRLAEVTAGGVPLGEVHARSLESRCVPGLHLAGEMLDVTGRLGGYNFLWAWVSGRRAGQAAASALVPAQRPC